MRKLLLSFFVLALVASVNAQTSYKKRPTLAVNFVLNDFKTASAIRSSSLSTVLNQKNWSRIGQMNAGLGLQFIKGITDHLDLNTNLQATFVDYQFKDGTRNGNEAALLEGDVAVNAKLLNDSYFFVPYATVGVGASLYAGTFAAYMPLGIGFQFNLGKQESFLFTNFQYRTPVTDKASAHFNYSIGFAAPIGK